MTTSSWRSSRPSSHRRSPGASRARVTLSLCAVLALGLAACGTDEAPGSEEEQAEVIRNCDVDVPVDEPPERLFAAYQPAIEMAHALGVSDRLVGTAYLDAEVLPEYAEAQQGQRYYENLPSREALLETEPDFVLSGFNGAFTDEQFGTRASLRELGIESWIFSPLCPSEDGMDDETIDPSAVTIEAIYSDLRELGTVFGASDRAEEIVADMQATIDEVRDTVSEAGDGIERPSVAVARPDGDGFRVAAGPDFTTELVKHAGGENAFADLEQRRNMDVSTEEMIARDPDHIFVDVCCDAEMTAADAADDVEAILSDPALANIEAVAEGNVHEFTFANRSAGVRSAPVIAEIAATIHPELF
ncbi:ABC transporter substrate-binding protein [Haloechinothrix sp. LS1_15]|uniref:ABC transporter substrate-binding protein n=1 Tax=Haloechinothrix sp. LS1_15 TaxID=2652248 RepID=UPI00294B251D|nr:ABC transporter substrate-binding protein [Haloechinothrix sp. LS1_15]